MESDKTKIDPGVLLNFLQEQHGNLGYYEHRKKKWLVCTNSHETWGISAIDALHKSMKEHERDGCLCCHILKNSVKKLNSEMKKREGESISSKTKINSLHKKDFFKSQPSSNSYDN